MRGATVAGSNDASPLGLALEQQTLGQVLAGHYDPDTGYSATSIGIDMAGVHATDERNLYCPAAVPCIGRPAVGVAIPVRDNGTGKQVVEVRGTYCPRCRTMRADQLTQ